MKTNFHNWIFYKKISLLKSRVQFTLDLVQLAAMLVLVVFNMHRKGKTLS